MNPIMIWFALFIAWIVFVIFFLRGVSKINKDDEDVV